MQSKQLSTNDLAVFDLDAVVIIWVERGSQIHGIRPLNKLTVGDVHRTLCKQKQTSALCATNGERNTSNRLWTCLLQQMRLEHFELSALCLFQLNIGQVMWRMLKYSPNP